MIIINHLQKKYGNMAVLKDVNATIQKGEIISVIGPSGTGKSTFLRCLNLLECPDGGEIIVCGQNLLAPETNVAELRMKMGMVFQSFNLFPHLTVLENITLAPRSLLKQSKADAEKLAHELLETVGLAHKANALPAELSGGQQQRIAIARTLAMSPEIILFDEPTSALDPTMVNEVLTVIRNLAKTGITMIIVTHEMRFAREVSSRIFYMDEGTIYEEGPARSLFENPKRAKTRAFIRHVGMQNFILEKSDFDLYHFQSDVDSFAEKQLLTPKQRKGLHLVLEELLMNVLFPHTDTVSLSIGISEETNATEIDVKDLPFTQNPMEFTDEAGEMARLILQKRCDKIKFKIVNSSRSELKMILS